MPRQPTQPALPSVGTHPDFIERPEYRLLVDQAGAGRNPILITGPFGSGKTAMVQQFVASLKKSRNVRWIVGAAGSYHRQDLLGLYARSSKTTAMTLVIDEADFLSGPEISELIQVVAARPRLQVILISVQPEIGKVLRAFKNASVIELKPLSYRMIEGLLDKIFPEGIPEAPVREFYARNNGNLRMLVATLDAFRAGFIRDESHLVEAVSDFNVASLVDPDGQPLGKKSGNERRIIVDVSAANAEVLKLLNRQPDLIWQVPSRKFEELVAEILEKQGYEVDLTPASGDGGFDMYAARKEGLGKFLYLVECKRYTPPNKVGVEIVRALNGVVHAKDATAGAIVTTSYFTKGAQEFQREQEHRMNLHDYIVLREWLAKYKGKPDLLI
jgi:restriction system protein